MSARHFLTRDLPASRWIERGHNARWLVAFIWLECAAFMLVRYWSDLGPLDFHDPDDALRLVQVRDFLAGQGWFDVSQHRINPPAGGPMHWSRLLDLPIAGFIALLRPALGNHGAEVVACAAMPLLTLGLLCGIMFSALRSLLGKARAIVAVVLLCTSFSILVQATPLRIDHHAWQIAMAALMMAGILHRRPECGGMIAGAAMAMWLHISSEGLPYAALAGAVLTLRYAVRPTEWPRLSRYAWTLALASAALLMLTKGVAGSLVSYCDALSPVYLLPIALVGPLLWLARWQIPQTTTLLRALPSALAGLAAAALFLRSAGPCLAGPFATLDPLVYQFWYRGVLEGLPIWDQEPVIRAIILLPALVGIVGTALALRAAKEPRARLNWLSLLLLAAGGLAIAIMVMRAMAVAHLFALGGTAWLISTLYTRSRAFPSMLARLACVALLCALSPAGLAALSSVALTPAAPATKGPLRKVPCSTPEQLAALARLPRATFFAPIDLGPDILAKTPHSVIGTGHHRNVPGMTKVIGAFLAPADAARTIVAGTGADYVLVCPRLDETDRYIKARPGGLMARLVSGQTPGWLEPVSAPGVVAMQLYRIKR